VVLAVTPELTTAGVGQTFTITLQVRAGTQLVDGVTAALDFNQSVLAVESIAAGSALPVPIKSEFNNEAGTISYSAGAFSNFPSGTFTLATVTFKALAEGTSPLNFHAGSDVTFGGASVLCGTVNGTVIVVKVRLLGSVTLEGRPPKPDPRWSVPLRVSLTPEQGGGPVATCTPTTDQNGRFTCDGLLPGAYVGCVKNSHTLQNCQTVNLVAGDNSVDFGTLLEGDANDDNCVTILDFSILVTTFGKCIGNPGFDSRADFNGDGCVTIVDFSLLRKNFGLCGAPLPGAAPSVEAAAKARGGSAAVVLVAPAGVRVGQRFTATLQIAAGTRTVDGAAAYVNFDPTVLQVEGLTAGERFGVELQRRLDNAAGHVDYAAGSLENFPAGTFTLAKLQFRALRSGTTRLVLNGSAPRRSDVTFGGASVAGQRQAATVRIMGRSGSARRPPGRPHPHGAAGPR